MIVPLNWLRDYVDLTGIGVPELVERLTLAGLEVTGVRCLGMPVPQGLHFKAEDSGPSWAPDKVVVGRVVEVGKHPNADKLKLVTVEYGANQPKVVVTAAPNIQVGDKGDKVILGLAGTVYFDGHATPKALKELKPSKLRGIPSDAMVMSEFELGISDEHEGVILLAEDEAPAPGTPAADFMGDIIVEIDVLPNMARCLSMIGVAREVAALFGRRLLTEARLLGEAGLLSREIPSPAMPAAGPAIAGQVEVRIEDPQLSARYAAALIREVKIGRSPAWLQRRLTYAGMRPISNIVDITNYVMLEWGQPLHAFDYDKLVQRAGGQIPIISVRPARAGEVLTTLDNVRRELTSENLVIADTAGPIAIAGVMGGLDTEVSSATTNILLESANFDFVSVRRTMKALNLPSEASLRFSKGIHPEVVRPAVERAADLMRAHAGGTVAAGLVDTYPAPLPTQVVELPLSEVRRQLGIEVPVAEAIRILHALEFQVEQEPTDSTKKESGPSVEPILRVTTPPHRRDVQAGTADLIEELVRIHGYDRLPATLMADQLPEPHTNRPLALEENLRDLLVDCGLQEVITYALTEIRRDAPVGLGQGEYVTLLNPISSERVVMRHSLLGEMLEVAADNLRHIENLRLFQVGSVYLLQPGQKLPEEPRRLALLMTGRELPEFWADGTGTEAKNLDFFDLKGVFEAVLGDLHLASVSYRRPADGTYTYLHPGRAAEIQIGGHTAGSFGQLHPRYAEQRGLGQRVVLAGEFDLDRILAAVPSRYAYTPVPRYPAALRDIAVIVEEDVTAERILTEIRAAGGELLADVRLFDLYRGESIPASKKSLAYALTYQAGGRTLIDKEVDKAHKKIEDRLKHVLNALIRGKD